MFIVCFCKTIRSQLESVSVDVVGSVIGFELSTQCRRNINEPIKGAPVSGRVLLLAGSRSAWDVVRTVRWTRTPPCRSAL